MAKTPINPYISLVGHLQMRIPTKKLSQNMTMTSNIMCSACGQLESMLQVIQDCRLVATYRQERALKVGTWILHGGHE